MKSWQKTALFILVVFVPCGLLIATTIKVVSLKREGKSIKESFAQSFEGFKNKIKRHESTD